MDNLFRCAHCTNPINEMDVAVGNHAERLHQQCFAQMCIEEKEEFAKRGVQDQ